MINFNDSSLLYIVFIPALMTILVILIFICYICHYYYEKKQLEAYGNRMKPEEVDIRNTRKMIERQRKINDRIGLRHNSNVAVPEIVIDNASDYNPGGSSMTFSSLPFHDTLMVYK
uniref:Uncharacterized protein n=2 Tax=Caenorhabditis tropicalis TaxID=1561998 RepID=A0A1I7UWK0_9PELO